MAISRKTAQLLHTKRRLRERYGLALNRHDVHKLILQIQEGKATYVCRQSCRVTKWVVQHKDKPILVCYDSKRQSIATALPFADSAPTLEG